MPAQKRVNPRTEHPEPRDRQVAESGPIYTAGAPARRRVRGLSLSDAIELSLRVRRGALDELAKR